MSRSRRESEPDSANEPLLGEALSQAFYRDQDLAAIRQGPVESKIRLAARLALYAIPVFIVIAICDCTLRAVMPPETLLPYMDRHFAFYTQKLDGFRNAAVPDVVVLGSSRIRDAFVPVHFSKDLSDYWGRTAQVYNLGLAGAQAEEVYTIAKWYLPDPPPPYLILGLSGREMVWVDDFRYASRFLWNIHDIFCYLDRVSFKEFRVKHIEFFIESMLSRIWYAFAQRDALSVLVREKAAAWAGLEEDPRRIKIRERERKRLIANVRAADGYSPVLFVNVNLEEQLRTDPDRIYFPKPRTPEQQETLYNEPSRELTKKIIKTFQETGSKIVVVEVPPSPALEEYDPLLHGSGFRSWMGEIARETGVLFLPFPPLENGLTNAMYGDLSHMTREGAKRYTNLLFERLRDAGFFEED